MAVTLTELERFHRFAAGQIDRSESELSWDDLLQMWRRETRDPAEHAADVQAVREAIEDLEAGQIGTPWEEFDQRFRETHGIRLDADE